IDRAIAEGGDVARPEVVPQPGGEGGIKHRLMLDERLRYAEVEQRRPEGPKRADDSLPILDRTGIAADHRDDRTAMQLARDRCERRRHAVHNDGCELIGYIGDPVAVEAKDFGRLLHRPDHRPGENGRPDAIQPELELGDDAEIGTSPLHTPEEIAVRLCAAPEEFPLTSHNFDGDELVDPEADLGHHPADALPT